MQRKSKPRQLLKLWWRLSRRHDVLESRILMAFQARDHIEQTVIFAQPEIGFTGTIE